MLYKCRHIGAKTDLNKACALLVGTRLVFKNITTHLRFLTEALISLIYMSVSTFLTSF